MNEISKWVLVKKDTKFSVHNEEHFNSKITICSNKVETCKVRDNFNNSFKDIFRSYLSGGILQIDKFLNHINCNRTIRGI